MTFGIFLHRQDSRYEDSPALHYQFPKQYLSRASQFVGDWIIYCEPTKVRHTRGYFAAARVERVVPDPTVPDHYLALIDTPTYLEFATPVPFRDADGIVERGLLNDLGNISGRAQAAVRPLSPEDFRRIVERGADEADFLLPRADPQLPAAMPDAPVDWSDQEQSEFTYAVDRLRVPVLTSRLARDRVFRKVILRAYEERCAVTGLKLINGGGRAEVDAAHIRPVDQQGPDIVSNGLALSGTAHWMFDRGMISIEDDLSIVISRHVNDRDSVENLINKTGQLIGPREARDRPHPAFLAWHREHCFKH